MTGHWEEWQPAFAYQVEQSGMAESLKRASLEQDLAGWTTCLTTVVVRACTSLGWQPAAKGNPSTRLPQHGKEYLGIDVTAFPPDGEQSPLWPMPVTVFELENHRKGTRVEYSLWKVICIRAELRVVFSYRPDWQQGRELVQEVGKAVIGSMTTEQRMSLSGETVLVVGNRGEGETFPWGYFKCWRLDANVGRFEKV